MKTFDNAIKPTQKPVCYQVQGQLNKYKSTTKENNSIIQCEELFQTIQTDTNIISEVPDAKIISQSNMPNSIKMTLKSHEIQELPIVQENETHSQSIFKYLQKDEQSQKLSTNTNSQHSNTSKQTQEIFNNQCNRNQSHKSNQPSQNQSQQNKKKDVSPQRSTSPYRQFLQRPQQNQVSTQQRTKSPFIKNTGTQKLTPRTNQRTTPSASPFRQAKENNISTINQRNLRTDKSQNKLIQVKIKETHNQNQSHVIVDLSKCPTQRVLMKQDSNRPKMKVELSLKSLIKNGI
ncbi:unnamed protein product [Paramecium primaurelia]|uniref:Uncharacterized protein n=1 Tax=Paramecium primaurelia TaxID=5886 RepID=A0A8S1LE83_PARPR|nr:unnamed protein product [Paramecium primaurelia]